MKIRLLAAALLLFSAGVARSSYIAELSLEEKAASSDLVVIGWVKSIKPDRRPISNPSVKFVRIATDLLMKGHERHEFTARIGSSIEEADPNCCVVGAVYIFFLKKSGEQYEVVNPPFGVKRLRAAERARASKD